YAWTFGDGNTSTVNPTTNTYGAPGSYNVTVNLTSGNGCLGNATAIAVVNPIPVADFTAPPQCQGRATIFTSTSTVATGTITGYAWAFGDGGTGTGATVAHRYAACGTYTPTLVVTSSGGCTHDTSITVTVNPVPAPSFNATPECKGIANIFTDASTVGCGGTIKSWSWNFGDGVGTSTIQNPTYTYANSGTYNVSLTVTSNLGCDSTITLPVIVYSIPVPSFTDNSPCVGNPTNFVNTSTVVGGTINASAWTFGDGGTSTVMNPSHTYAAAGTYPVTLIVTSNFGCIDSITKNVVVNPLPAPDFKANDTLGCAPMCVQFTDLSTVANANTITGWSWNFGDGSSDSSSNLQNPKHCYTKVGTFTVELTVTTNNGCTMSFTRVNYITTWPTPVARFNASPNPTTMSAPTVTFTDQSQGNPVKWNWVTFGDNSDNTSTSQDTMHTYGDTGTYYVQLDIVNKYGCKDSIIEPVVIQPMWTFYVPNAFTPNADGTNDGFIGKGVGIRKYEMWIFDRWGMLLYHCTDMQHPWDGTVQGTSGLECQEDTYVWLIEIEDVFHNNHRYVGRVSIIR
ncbi:MAG TPA: PKD domain-containing protein, partial [Bacteroidia bacterium]|nr:PKD domain-containing protein [Bacteroidia bacterium]